MFDLSTFTAVANLLLAGRLCGICRDCSTSTLIAMGRSPKAVGAVIGAVGLAPCAARMAERARQLDRHLTHGGWAKEDARRLFWQAAPYALSDPAALDGPDLVTETATQAMIASVLAGPVARDFQQSAYAETYFRRVMVGLLEEMLADPPALDDVDQVRWRGALFDRGLRSGTDHDVYDPERNGRRGGS